MDTLRIKIKDKWFEVEVLEFSTKKAVFLVDGEQMIVTPGSKVTLDTSSEQSFSDLSISKSFTAPMPGTVIELLVEVGQKIDEGEEVCILESMKMQQVLRSEVSGVVKRIVASEGDQILDGQVIFDLE
ncbi:MAG: hypothetical protein CL781_02380 [Chloroflexi bacterium]|nr:hypothetical protein [Chloroflexota bacterium]|tara:strand:- start:191 stop:574 length:384 start_codon:yes stop_codon:yes gene_type:complete